MKNLFKIMRYFIFGLVPITPVFVEDGIVASLRFNSATALGSTFGVSTVGLARCGGSTIVNLAVQAL